MRVRPFQARKANEQSGGVQEMAISLFKLTSVPDICPDLPLLLSSLSRRKYVLADNV